jgi:hydrogenase-1 operon protein HyaF
MFGETEGPVLVGLPAPVQARQAVHLPDRDELSPAAFELLSAVRDTLLAPPGTGVVFSLDELEARDRQEMWQVLGEGEVSIVVQGTSRYEIEETSLTGVFRVRTRKQQGEALHLEVGAVPAIVVAAAEHGTSPELPIETPPPAGLMNAQPLLAELRHRMATLVPGAPNHVVSLTLLPLSDADGAYLARTLGAGPVQAESRGYGTCRVRATARRGVWAVQYFNAMDAMILDTLEVGGVPDALIAAPTDLQDSGARLTELLDHLREPS